MRSPQATRQGQAASHVSAASSLLRCVDVESVGVLSGLRILLVEDESEPREALAALLTTEGADVTAAGTATDAFDMWRREHFDVLLTDLGLPDVPGQDLIRRVRDGEKARAIIVVVTGCDEPTLTDARTAGADAVLLKPVDWPVLLSRLRGTTSPRAAA